MKLLIASLLLATASPAAVMAAPDIAEPTELASEVPSPVRLALARQFIGLVNPADRMMDDFKTGMLYGASAQLDEIEDEAARTQIEDRLDLLLIRLEPKLTELMPSMLESYAQVYAGEFTEVELQHLIAFAETPVGKHYLAKADLLEYHPAMIEANREMSDGIAPIMEEFRKESCAKLAAERLAAGDTKAKCPLSGEADTRSS
jgi:hypothetical protein